MRLDSSKRFLPLCIAILVIMSFTTGCRDSGSRDQSLNQYERDSEGEIYGSTTDHSETQEFTYEDAVEDYDYLSQLLDESYPFCSVAERMYGIKVTDIKAKFLDGMKEYQADMPIEVFAELLAEAVESFHGAGEFHFIDSGMYEEYLKLYQDSDKNAMNYKTLHNDKVRKTYGYLADRETNSLMDEEYNESPPETSYSILENNVAYLKVPIMRTGEGMNEEWKRINGFYEEITDCHAFIIDITGNRGGNDFYWWNNLVIPNIDKAIEYGSYFSLKQSRINMDFLKEQVINIKSMERKIEEAYSLVNINKGDIEGLNSFYRGNNRISPLEPGKKKFYGDIYVLTDEEVHGSASNFAKFCKDTDFATVIGRESGGGGVNYLLEELPNSGLLISYSILYLMNEDGSSIEEYGITPDYISGPSETPLDTCLRIINVT